MIVFSDLLGMLAFHAQALRAQAERRAVVAGIISYSLGYLAYALVRNTVYAALPEFVSGRSGVIGFFFNFNLVQTLLFILLVYVPAVIILSNGISGNGLGLSISRHEYLTHVSALLPLWGLLFLVSAPLQWLVPHFLVLGMVEISVGMFVRSVLMLVYTLWAIQQLDYLSLAQAFGVFTLSWFTLPIYFLLTSFLLAVTFFFMIPLIYLAYQWIRGQAVSQRNTRAFQQHLHTLTLNPQDADAHYQLGLIHLRQRHMDSARKCFENALKIDSNDPDYHYFLGRTYELKGEWAQALEHYEETYRLDPEYGLGDIFREVGKGYLHTGNLEKGMEFLRFFLKKRDSDPEGRYWLAVVFQRLGDLEQMLIQLNMIVERARTSPRFYRKEHREWIYRARTMIRNSKFVVSR